MNGARCIQRVSFPVSIKKEPKANGNATATVPVKSVSTSSFTAVIGTTDKSKFAAETGLSAAAAAAQGQKRKRDGGDGGSGDHTSTVPENAFDMPTERGVTACIPYNHNSARPTGTALFLHGRIEDTRVFGRAPHLRYLDLEEGVRLPACLTERIERVVRATSQKFDQYERKLPVRPDVCFYDTYEIPIAEEVFRCPVDFNGKVMTVSGTFCSEACVLAYLRDGRAGPRAKQHGATWLAALRRWRDCLGPPTDPKDHFIDAALHYTALERFGGPLSIQEYRERGQPRSSYRRHITYVFPQHFRLVPSGYIHIREDRAQPPQQHTVRSVLSGGGSSSQLAPPTPTLTTTPKQTPMRSWSTPAFESSLPPASPFALGVSATATAMASSTPNFVAQAPIAIKRRRLKRIETSDDEAAGVTNTNETSRPMSQTSPKNDYYRIRRIEQNQMGRRKRQYVSGDADVNYQRKAVSRRRKKAVGKQTGEPQPQLKQYFTAEKGFH